MRAEYTRSIVLPENPELRDEILKALEEAKDGEMIVLPERSPEMAGQAENGMLLETLAETAHNVYNIIADGRPMTWAEVPPQIQDVWGPVAAKAVVLIEGADGLHFRDLATELYRMWAVGMKQKDLPFDDLPVRTRLIWEAIGRHLTNLIDSDGVSVEPPDHEERWKRWVDEKEVSVRG